jgi:hypothetical protein
MQDHPTRNGLVDWYGINTGQTANWHVFSQPAMMSGSVTATPAVNTDTVSGFADSANGASLASSLRLATAQPPSGLSLVPVCWHHQPVSNQQHLGRGHRDQQHGADPRTSIASAVTRRVWIVGAAYRNRGSDLHARKAQFDRPCSNDGRFMCRAGPSEP